MKADQFRVNERTLPVVDDSFDDWLRAPICESPDERLVIRRATERDFDRIFDLVDATFGRPRPREMFGWLYRQNPLGPARCWIIIDRASDQIISSEARVPWPLARGIEPRQAVLICDVVTAPNWQRRGLFEQRQRVKDSHPAAAHTVAIGIPNPKSLGAVKKHGLGEFVMGPLPRYVLPIDYESCLNELGVPRFAAAIGQLADAFAACYQRMLNSNHPAMKMQQVRSFDATYDAITLRHGAWPGYWCPHSAEFLNWRYLRHPRHEYVAISLSAGEPCAFCVVRLSGRRAMLMEFVAPRHDGERAGHLLFHAARIARAAGCNRLEFLATPAWPHWKLLRRAGFFPWPSRQFLVCRGSGDPGVSQLANWRIVPGDTDFL